MLGEQRLLSKEEDKGMKSSIHKLRFDMWSSSVRLHYGNTHYCMSLISSSALRRGEDSTPETAHATVLQLYCWTNNVVAVQQCGIDSTLLARQFGRQFFCVDLCNCFRCSSESCSCWVVD